MRGSILESTSGSFLGSGEAVFPDERVGCHRLVIVPGSTGGGEGMAETENGVVVDLAWISQEIGLQ